MRRRNHNPRSTRTRCVVDGARVVGAICSEATETAINYGDQVDRCCGVIGVRFGQALRDDHARAIDTEMEFPPAPFAGPAMLGSGPLPFPERRQAAAVNQQVERAAC